MTTRADYTDNEWKLLMDAPTLVGMGVSMADFGVVSFAKEFAALIRAVIGAKEKYPSNQLIQSLVAEFEKKDQSAPADSGEGKKSQEDMLADLGKVAALVDTKAAGDEARGFKTFLVDLSEQVANASGEGFLGFGEKVSDKERDYLQKLRTTLSV